MSTKTKKVSNKNSSTKVIKTPAAKSVKQAPVVKLETIPADIKNGRGRPKGSLSYVEVPLSTLIAILNPNSMVRIDRKFSNALNLNGTTPAPTPEVKQEESSLAPVVTEFTEENPSGDPALAE